MPQVVIIIDELADLMMAAPSQVEESICRLAQAGPGGRNASDRSHSAAFRRYRHRPHQSEYPVENRFCGVFSGGIPRTILDRAGAEKLVGKGDMLFNPIGKAQPERLQGPFVTDDEVNAVIGFWKEQAEKSDAPNRIMESINTAIR